MTTTIRIARSGRVRIEVGAAASVTITTGSGGVSIRVTEDPDLDAVSRYLGGRAMAKRRSVFRAQPGVSAEMEAAAIRSFLAGADVARLGRSLAAVYEAMEAVRQRDDIE